MAPSFFVRVRIMRVVAWLSATMAMAVALGACGTPRTESRIVQQDWAVARAEMVRRQLRGRDIVDPRVLDAMGRVERHLFVPESARSAAYEDMPLTIGQGQTISQPYIVAFMTQALEVQPDHRVLEVGTGSGYQAAILAELVKELYTIEIVPELGERARATLERLNYRNAQVRIGNGYFGWPEHAPYDRIMVTAAPEDVPSALVEQLRIGGLMAIPVGVGDQELRILRRTDQRLETLRTLPVRFVPMTGKPK
jgi:protein-L-isoaspartate(D-aspartate) O-methyltransferase